MAFDPKVFSERRPKFGSRSELYLDALVLSVPARGSNPAAPAAAVVAVVAAAVDSVVAAAVGAAEIGVDHAPPGEAATRAHPRCSECPFH